MIRKAEKRDASRLAEILIFAKRNAYRRIFQDDDGSFNQLQVLPLALEYRDDPEMLKGVYVYDDGIVKGMSHWECSGKEELVIELKELYIDVFFQGEGIGKLLLNELMNQANQLGVRKLKLWVLEQNERARALYEGYGFRENGIQDYEDGYPVILLQYEKMLE